jgi:hypothetical protein
MSYNVKWHKQDRVLYVTYTGKVTAEDIEQANQQVLEELEKAAHTIHALVNVVGMTKVDFSLQEVMASEVVSAVSGHPTLGWVIYFNKKNPYYNFLASIVGQNFGERVMFLDSEEEAVAFVNTRL